MKTTMTGTISNNNQSQPSSSNVNCYGYMTATGDGSPYYQHSSSHIVMNQSQILIPGPMMNHSTQQYPYQQPLFSALLPSKSNNHPYCEFDPQSYCNHFYQFGFLQGNFSDITVQIPNLSKTFALHSLILSRSPYLNQRMSRLQMKRVLELEYDLATVESFHLIFSHLYRPLTRLDMTRLGHENPQIYIELIDLADYLQLLGLKQVLVQLIEFDDTMAIRWSESLDQRRQRRQQRQQRQMEEATWIKDVEGRLMTYLTRNLLKSLQKNRLVIGQHQMDTTVIMRYPDDLVTLYAALPLEYVIRCLEYLPDPLQRYQFATQVTKRRDGISIGLRFDQQQMTVAWIRTPRRKIGKWDPSLDDDSDA